jgi:hypothetical protein
MTKNSTLLCVYFILYTTLCASRLCVSLSFLSLSYSTVTLFARLRGWSTSAPRRTAVS